MGGEGFVGFDQIKVGGLPASLFQSALRSWDRSCAHDGGVDASCRERRNTRQWGQTALGGFGRTHDNQRCCAVIDARGIACGDGAVLFERRAQRLCRIHCRAFANIFVLIDGYIALAAFNGDGGDFCVKAASGLSGFGFVLTGGGKLVLLVTRDLPLLGDIFCRDAHMIGVEGIRQAIADHGVDQA